jgi:hypothetical protein
MKGLSSPINFIDHKEAVLFTGNALSDRIQFGRYRSIRVGKVCIFNFACTFCVQINSNLASVQSCTFGTFGSWLYDSPKGDSRSALSPHLDIVEQIIYVKRTHARTGKTSSPPPLLSKSYQYTLSVFSLKNVAGDSYLVMITVCTLAHLHICMKPNNRMHR